MSFKEICRTCLRSARILFPIVDSTITIVGVDPILVSDMLKVFNIEISHEGQLPNQICTDCLNEIQRSYHFKLKCQRSEALLHQLKCVKIKLKKMKSFPIKLEYDNDKTCEPYKELNLNISQIKTEDIESEDNNSLSNSNALITKEFAEDCQLEPVERTNNVPQKMDLVMQDINQDSEQQNEKDLSELDIESEDQSIADKFKCPGCSYDCLNLEALIKHVLDHHINISVQFCKICNKEFECTAIQHCSKHLYASLDILHSSVITTKKMNENLEKDNPLSNDGTREKPLKCEVCSKDFLSDLDRNAHMITDHGISTVQNDLVCSICYKVFQCTSEDDIFKCHICSEIFRYKVDLKTHFALIHDEQNLKYSANFESNTKEMPFNCKICLISFRYKQNFQYHMQAAHGIIASNDDESDLQCPKCSKLTFRRKTSLKMFMKSNKAPTDLQCKICFIGFKSKEWLKYHLEVAHKILESTEKEDLQCSMCSRKCKDEFSLNEHMRNHTLVDADKTKNIQENKFYCDICSKCFADESYLTLHLKSHTKEKFKCKSRPEVFRIKRNFQYHMQEAHNTASTGNKTGLSCPKCPKRCRFKSDLKMHMRKHCEPKSIRCKICSNAFQSKAWLAYHLKVAHEMLESTEKANLQCSICSKICKDEFSLTAHMRVHSLVDANKTIHETILCCDFCSECFTSESNLDLHLKSHSKEKLFKCNACPETFQYKLTFKNHMRTKHNVE